MKGIESGRYKKKKKNEMRKKKGRSGFILLRKSLNTGPAKGHDHARVKVDFSGIAFVLDIVVSIHTITVV